MSLIHAIRIFKAQFEIANVPAPTCIEIDRETAERLREEMASQLKYVETKGVTVTRVYDIEIRAPQGFRWS